MSSLHFHIHFYVISCFWGGESFHYVLGVRPKKTPSLENCIMGRKSLHQEKRRLENIVSTHPRCAPKVLCPGLSLVSLRVIRPLPIYMYIYHNHQENR